MVNCLLYPAIVRVLRGISHHQTYLCIDIVEIWFGIANGQHLSIFDRVICPLHDSGKVLSFQVLIFSLNDHLQCY